MKLRPFQAQAIQFLQENVHLVCVAPTGSGKSIIYEHTIYREHLRTLIVSPLVALAKQQRKTLESEEVIVCNPEWLERNFYKAESFQPDFLVVDECHCIDEWGKEFRPAFRNLTQIPARLKIRKSLWLSATIHVRMKEILENELPQPQKWIGESKIPKNLELVVIKSPWTQRLRILKWIVERQKEPGIVFTSSRISAERLQGFLSQFQISTCFYHAGMSAEERTNIENLVSQRKVQVVVCTSAFGMGMDFPWMRWVILFDIPYSVLALIQGVGRVTRREHQRSKAYFLWDDVDFSTTHIKNAEWNELEGFYRETGCRVRYLETYLNGKSLRLACNQCDLCYSRQS